MPTDAVVRNNDRLKRVSIVVSDHDNPSRRYAFDDTTGAWSTRRLWPWADQVRGISGYGAVLPVAVTIYPYDSAPSAKTLLALYAIPNVLRFRIGQHAWDVTDPAMHATVTKGDRASVFELAQAGTPIVRVEYGFYSSSEDFFIYVEETLANGLGRESIVRRWTSHP